MAKYKPPKGGCRTPEEYRKIQQQIDELQHERSKRGVKISKKRRDNTFGVSSTMYKKGRKPKTNKPRIHDLERYARRE